MSEKLLRKHFHVFQNIKRGSPKLRKAIISLSGLDLTKALCEVCINVLNGNLPVEPEVRKKLSPFKSVLRSLCCRKVSLRKKRKLLVQKGGFLPALLGTLLSTVIGAIASR